MHFRERLRAVLLQRERRGVDRGRNRRAKRPVARNRRLAREQRRRRCLRRGSLTVDHDDALVARGVDDDRRFTTEAEMRDLDDRGRKNRRDAGVDRVAPRREHLRAGIGHERPPGGHDAVVGADFAAKRRERLLRRHVNAQRGERLPQSARSPHSQLRPRSRAPHSAIAAHFTVASYRQSRPS